MDGYEYFALIMKALGHPVRLQILHALRDSEACVCHLEAVLGQRQAYISQQLMRLRTVGLVIDRRDGMNVYYSLASNIIINLLDIASRTAQAISQEDIHFKPIPTGAEVDCCCPKCQTEAITIS